jgi:hypothetical protein
MSPAALFAGARDDAGTEVVQVNHPVIGSSGSQYFQVYEVNPFTGEPEAAGFSFDFDALEVMNGRYIEQGLSNLETWMRILNNGHRITATGNSDSHHLVYSEPGYPRNYVEASVDTPADAGEVELTQAVLAGAVFVTYGPIVDFRVNGAGLGRLIPAAGGAVEFDVRVQCPSWIGVTEGRIYANAEILASFPIEAANPGPLDVRWQGSDLPKHDTWYLLFVEGEGDLAPVRRGAEFRPLAFTNPVWVDVDGDGKFTPPGTFSDPDAIVEIDAVDENGVPELLGEWVALDGCARTDTRFLDPSSGIFYLEDETGGVQVREKIGSLTEVRRGDRVQAAGFVAQVLGETIVSDVVVEVVPGGPSCPPAAEITTGEIGPGAELFEGRVVHVTGASVTSGSWPSGGAGGSVTVDDGTGAATLLIPSGVVVPPEAGSLDVFGFTALVTQRDFSLPYHSGYSLTLRSGDDLFEGGSTGAALVTAPGTRRPHPNPFATQLTIPLGSGSALPTRVEILDVAGRRVRVLQGGAGAEELVWDTTDERGRPVSSGVYFVRLLGEQNGRSYRVVKRK